LAIVAEWLRRRRHKRWSWFLSKEDEKLYKRLLDNVEKSRLEGRISSFVS
jgi:hypothetical protein